MKQAAPSKNVTPKKKRRRVQTDFSGSKAKRRKEARRRLLQAEPASEVLLESNLRWI